MSKIIDNMEIKVLTLKKDLRKALQKVDYLISDINKLKASEEVNSVELKGGKK